VSARPTRESTERWKRAQEEKRLDEARRLAETRRIERQRTLFAMLGDTSAKERLKETMLQRAYDLMCEGQPAACDALCEFLPEKDADAMGNAWLDDQCGEGPKSKWH
jgi:hypothetical protein